jgi:hypothetical protein
MAGATDMLNHIYIEKTSIPLKQIVIPYKATIWYFYVIIFEIYR